MLPIHPCHTPDVQYSLCRIRSPVLFTLLSSLGLSQKKTRKSRYTDQNNLSSCFQPILNLLSEISAVGSSFFPTIHPRYRVLFPVNASLNPKVSKSCFFLSLKASHRRLAAYYSDYSYYTIRVLYSPKATFNELPFL